MFIYVDVIKNYKELHAFKRYVVPVLSIFGGLYLIYGAFTSSPKAFMFYTIIVLVFLGVAYVLRAKNLSAVSE